MERKALVILIVVFIPVVCVGSYFLFRSKAQKTETSMQSVVKPDETANWKNVTTDYAGVTFKYPDLPTAYIRGQQWPPKLTLISAKFFCEGWGTGVTGIPDTATKKTIGGTTYCIRSDSRGAAGTIFTTYTYSFEKGTKLIGLVFILAYPQCDNYDEPNKTNCQNERQTFDLDALIDRIARTVVD